MIQHGGDRLLPIVIERQPAERTSTTLPWSFEGNDVEPGRCDVLPDREELLDQRVEPTVQERGAPARSADGCETVRRQRGIAVGDVVRCR